VKKVKGLTSTSSKFEDVDVTFNRYIRSDYKSINFLTETSIGIIANLGVGKFCPNSKFPDKSSYGLTRSDCIS